MRLKDEETLLTIMVEKSCSSEVVAVVFESEKERSDVEKRKVLLGVFLLL